MLTVNIRGLRVPTLALTFFLALSGSAAADETISEKARLYFGNGVELLQSDPPNYQDAYHQFKRAYDESGSWKVLGNLGFCALKLERDGEALEFYAEYLKRGGDEVEADERAALERETLLVMGNTGVLLLTASEPQLEIVNARSGSSVPAQAYQLTEGKLALRLRAGVHTITATTADGRKLEHRVTMSPDQNVQHHFDFQAQGAALRAEGDAATKPKSPLRTIGFVTAGAGGLALLGAGITGIVAMNKDAAATSRCGPELDTATQKPICPPGSEANFDSAARMARASNILWIAGGTVAAAGIGMIIFGGSDNKEKDSASVEQRIQPVRLVPVLTPNGGGLVAAGTL